MTKFMATMITHDDDDDDNDNDDDDEEANTPQTAALLPCNVAGHPTPSIRSLLSSTSPSSLSLLLLL